MKNWKLNIIGIVAVITALFFATWEKKMNTGIKIENMNMSVRPGDDFYDYATGGWRVANPIPDDYSRYGSFDVLHNTNLERVREIAETDHGKIGTLYKIAMDEKKLNTDGIKPVQKYMNEIDALKSPADLPEYLGRAHKHMSAFWGDAVAADETNSDFYLYNLAQGGTGLSRDYYFDDDEKSRSIREKYKKYIADICKNFSIECDADKLFALELRMAKSFNTKEVLRDPHANYHKITITELKKEIPDFDWDKYFAARGANPAHLNLAQPRAISESVKIMNDTDFELIKTYLKYVVANSAAGVLDDKTYDIAFDFYNRTMAGQKEPKPRWKRAVALLNAGLGEEIGRLYADKYFPADAKKRMDDLVENLRRAYAERIKNLDWMSDATKTKALEKLATFRAKIGYPDVWRDYSKLEIKDDSLYENMMRVHIFEDEFWLNKIDGPVDRNLWYMDAHTVNAYYDPSSNEICFPAGILQYPFFDMDADDAFNYGAIGSVIGHEMTHGFDDMGRKFDKDGNLKDWWTDADSLAFDKRAAVMREFFDKILVAPNTYANGEFTLGENLADYGGITIAFTAYKNFGKSADDKNFFIAYAMTEAGNVRDDEILRLTKMDEHSLSRWRVNGILPHIGAWYDAFGITPDDKMYITPNARVKIW